MRQIFKNYLATFIKNWLQTIGTVLFILMMFAAVIGFLAAPLQIYSRITDMNRENNKYSQVFTTKSVQLSDDFLDKFVYNQNADASYMQNVTKDGVETNDSKEILKIEGLNHKEVLSPIAKDIISTKDSESRHAYMRDAITDASWGALTPTYLSFELNMDKPNADLEKAYENNINSVISDITFGIVNDATLAEKNPLVKSRTTAFISKIFTANNFAIPSDIIFSQPNHDGDVNKSENFGEKVVSIMKDSMNKGDGNKPIKKKTVRLLGIQVFNSEPLVVNGTDKKSDRNPFYENNMLTKLTDPQYSFNFYNYLTRLAIYDGNNAYATTANESNYKYSTENSMYFAKQDSSSIFPTKSIVLKNINSGNEANQLQLEKGRLPEKVDFSDRSTLQKYFNPSYEKKAYPEIVINSNYAKNNNLSIGDEFTVPAGNELSNIIDQSSQNSDAYLTDSITYKIVGIGEKFEDSVPDSHYTPYMESIKNYGTAYVDNSWFSLLKEAKWFNSSSNSSDFESSLRFNSLTKQDNLPKVFNVNYDDKLATNGVFSNNPFKNYNETKSMKSLNNIKIRVIIFLILGAVVLILAFVFINFTITKELNETRKQIGIFKSFGYKISELSWVFAIKTFLTIFLGAVLGYVVSIGVQVWSASSYVSSVMFAFDNIYSNGVFLAIIFVVIPFVFLLASYFLTLRYLMEPTLSLLSNGRKVKKQTKNHDLILKALVKRGKGFRYRLQQGFVKDSMGKFIVVQILFAFASLTFTLMLGAQDLMYSVADQGFGLMTDDADHQYWWTNQNSFDIKSGDKYKFNNIENYEKQNFKYIPYKDGEKIGDALDKSTATSDSRYRADFLVGSIANTFGVNHEVAMELLMPLDWYLVRDAGVKPSQLPQVVAKIKGQNPDDEMYKNWYKPAAEIDAQLGDDSNNQIAKQKMAYSNYYLNWILSFRISTMPATVNEVGNNKVMSVDDIKKSLNQDSTKFNINDLREYVNGWQDKSNSIRLQISSIMGPNSDDAKKKFKDTLFGLTDENDVLIDENGHHQKNNLYLADVTKIITLELAENYAQSIYSSALPPHSNSTDVVSALNAVAKNNVMKDFNPNDKKYWGTQSNPLMQSPKLKESMQSKKTDNVSLAASSESNSSGVSLSSFGEQTISLIMAASMLGYNSKNIDEMPAITLNQAFFNKDKEALFENITIDDVDNTQPWYSFLTLFDYKNNEYGKYENSLNHEGVSDATYKKLATDDIADKDKNAIYAVIPYGLAKYRNLKVGDLFTASTTTKIKKPVNLRIIGINKSATYAIAGGWQIDVDYHQVLDHYFSDELGNKSKKSDKEILEETPEFNSWISNEPMLEGNINLKDIPGSINSMRYVGKNLAIQIKPGASIFGSIFNGMLDFTNLLGITVDGNYGLVTNPNIASVNGSKVWPFNILRAGVNSGISEVNNILIVFIILVAIMLMIILVVVMNIVIEEATPIILTLKSLGYNRFEINWITMGSYVLGAAISFLVAYCLSLLVWNIFLLVAGNLWHIYVFMHYTWKAPVITILVIGAILAIGWYVSNQKVQKIPLTLVTGFN